MSMLSWVRTARCVQKTSGNERSQRPIQARTKNAVCSHGGWASELRAGLAFPPIKAIQRLLIRTSYDDEFRDSRSIALGLHKRYKDVLNGGFSNNLKEFIRAGVTAYEVGCTDEGMRKELLSIGDLNELSDEVSGGSVGLKSRLATEEVEECILWLSLVFLTILCSPPPTVVRWSNTPAVSAEAQLQWRGFCALIANAYYTRGMAWLPVKTLQLEQMAVSGYAEEPSLVADRMRLVFDTLEEYLHCFKLSMFYLWTFPSQIICPQWPKQ